MRFKSTVFLSIVTFFAFSQSAQSGYRDLTVLYEPKYVSAQNICREIDSLRTAGFNLFLNMRTKVISPDDCQPLIRIDFGWYIGYKYWRKNMEEAYHFITSRIDIPHKKHTTTQTTKRSASISDYSYVSRGTKFNQEKKDIISSKASQKGSIYGESFYDSLETIFGKDVGIGLSGYINPLYFTDSSQNFDEDGKCEYVELELHDPEWHADQEWKGTLVLLWGFPLNWKGRLNEKYGRLIFPIYFGIKDNSQYLFVLVIEESHEKREVVYRKLKSFFRLK